MPSAADRIDFGPPRDAGAIRAFGMALMAHILLVLALTWGINWKQTESSATFSAELWPAAPQPSRAPEPPPVVAAVPVTPAPPEPAPRAPEPIKVAPPAPEVDIALAQEKEKKRKLLEQKKEAEAKKEKEKQDKAKQLAAAEEAKKADAQKLAKQQATDKQVQANAEKLRQENLKRMLTGLPGDPSPSGTPSKSNVGGNGPSREYGAILRRAIQPNVVFTEEASSSLMTTIEVRLQSDGTVISQKMVKSSGNTAWDNAAANAITRTRVMPKDVDGRLPDTLLIINIRP